jgi:hypothetical protein
MFKDFILNEFLFISHHDENFIKFFTINKKF